VTVERAQPERVRPGELERANKDTALRVRVDLPKSNDNGTEVKLAMSHQQPLHPHPVSPDEDIGAKIGEGLADLDAGREVDGEEAFRQLRAYAESWRRASAPHPK
jgi:hypothetical protein